MKLERNVLISGGVILGILLLGGSFAGGIAVGRATMPASPEPVNPPPPGAEVFDVPPGYELTPGILPPGLSPDDQGGFPDGGPDAAPNNPDTLPPGLDAVPQVLGRSAEGAEGGLLTVIGEDGPVQVRLSEDTAIRNIEGQALSAADIPIDGQTMLAIYGEAAEDGVLTAREVVVLE